MGTCPSVVAYYQSYYSSSYSLLQCLAIHLQEAGFYVREQSVRMAHLRSGYASIIESRPNPSCRCDKSYQRCLKTQMDVSISAYVYRCLPSSPPSRIDSTPEAVNNL